MGLLSVNIIYLWFEKECRLGQNRIKKYLRHTAPPIYLELIKLRRIQPDYNVTFVITNSLKYVLKIAY